MKRPEEAEQSTYFDWLEWQSLKDPRLKLAFHVSSENNSSLIRRVKMKKAGLKKGVPDVMVPVPCGLFHGLFLEFKVKPNKPTKEQLQYIHLLQIEGYFAQVVWSADEAISVTTRYLALQKSSR